jgi:hypothetical protein
VNRQNLQINRPGTVWATRELSNDEIRALQRWQQKMVVLFVLVMTGLLITAAADIAFGLSETAAWYIFLVLLSLVVVAGFVQFGQKCPVCSYRLGFQTRLLVPERCNKCHVRLK